MAITDSKKGVWDTDEVYNKINQGGIWTYTGPERTLFNWGQNYQGMVGNNTKSPGGPQYSSPVQIGTDATWSEARGIAGQSFAIKQDGTLWSWGYGLWGRLAQNSNANYSSPMQVGSGTDWSKLARGAQGAMGIATKTNGTLWSWGYDQYGQLGVNEASPNMISSPTQLPGTNWTDEVSNCGSHILAIKSNGTLWAWGQRAQGMLGNNQNTSPNPNGISSPTQIGTDTTWSKACSGGGVSMMIKNDNTLWVWGDNTKGCLGLNAPQTSDRSSPTQLPGLWSDAAMLGTAVHGLKTDGTLWSWGAQDGGMLGLNQKATPGDDARSSPAQIGTDTTWNNLASGNSMGICGKTDGTWWTWGYNEVGKLGHNETNNVYRSSPTQLPGDWAQLNHRADGMMGLSKSV